MYKKLIVLCATQRCGSTMIMEDMRNSSILGRPEEYFIPWNPMRKGIDWRAEYENILKKASSPNGVASFKVMANQLPDIEAALGGESVENSKAFPKFKELTGEAVWVYIRREDILRQAISREISRQTGINHATADSKDEHFAGNTMKGYRSDYNKSVKYSEAAIRKALDDIVSENILWERFFRDWDIIPYTITYENAVHIFPHYLEMIAQMSGVTLPEKLPERKMVKLSNEVNEEWYERYSRNVIGKIALIKR